MATRSPTPRRGRTRSGRPARTAEPVRSAAARAVDRVLSSEEAFALLIRRLEADGWHIEREPERVVETARAAPVGLTPPSRAR